MKKRPLFINCFVFFLIIACASDDEEPMPNDPIVATTAITDTAFEQALIDLDLDDALDGEVRTSRIENIRELILDNKGITNIEGLGGFANLENISLNDNQVVSLDASKNSKLKFIFIDDNALTSLTVTGLSVLEKISAKNNALSTLNLNSNSALQLLDVPNNNLTRINVANNPDLNNFTITGNPLSCIQVSQTQLNAIPLQWTKDETDEYALDCQ